MKVLFVLAVVFAATFAAVVPPAPEVPVNGTLPVPPPPPPPPPAAVAYRGGARSGRYILLETGSVYDRVYDFVIPVDAQYVVQSGAGGNRDIYIRTVPLKTYRTEYVLKYNV